MLRKDVVVELNEALANAIERGIRAARNDRGASSRATSSSTQRLRNALLEPSRVDPNAHERVVGASDFVAINFLAKGLRAADSVCMVRVPNAGGGWSGTGFLVASDLLLTNNHVLPSADMASQCNAEFGHQHDLDGVLQPSVRFNLAPHRVFYTNSRLDFTLVSVAPYSDGGVPLARYGFLPLIPVSGKGLPGEWVTIPQHPGGQPKQIVVRACQILELDPKDAPGVDRQSFIHYSTDTQPGSSGAPVLNDQWQVVAVHHKAIPRAGQDFARLREENEEPEWVGNQGVRISAIFDHLQQLRFSNIVVARALDQLEAALGLSPSKYEVLAPWSNDRGQTESDPGPHEMDKWDAWQKDYALGYDPTFLSTELTLDDILRERKTRAAALLDKSGYELKYLHFSSVVDSIRCMPLLTAVNIDGGKLRHPGEREGQFRIDARLDAKFQPAAEFYEKKLGKDPVSFSRGHMVRRFDPCWGSSEKAAKLADSHTFHYTNAAPQVQAVNGGKWLDIEDYLLGKAQFRQTRLSVFTGPIFRDNDPEYGHDRTGGPWKVPVSFWKVIVMQKSDEKLAATAFILGQINFLDALYEAQVFGSLRKTGLAELQSDNLQTTIAEVERQTGLNFRALRAFDVSDALESTRRTRVLARVEDIIFGQ